ncbi:MAG: MBL fold metallo-hydrolase RNA specificity domain-containing protein, partial [Polyangiaceae bacterium]
ATGTQAEARAALARLSRGDHPHFTVGPGDVVAFSSRIIPGNEPEVYRMMGDLLRRGVEVRSRATDKDIHVSGHAHRGEQRRMIELTRPKAFLPLHGTMHHLSRHAELAREAGVRNVLVIENGAVAEVGADGTLEAVGNVRAGRVYTNDGQAVVDSVIRERSALAEAGVISAFVRLGRTVTIKLQSRGVVDVESGEKVLKSAMFEAIRAVTALLSAEPNDASVMETARLAIRRVIAKELGSKPITLVSVVREGHS